MTTPPIMPKGDTVVICVPTQPYNHAQLDPPFITILNQTTGRPEKLGLFVGAKGEAGQVAIEVPLDGAVVLQNGQRNKNGKLVSQSFALVIEGGTECENSPASAKKKLLQMCREHAQKYSTEESKK